MATYRTIRMSFWNDPAIESLPPGDKLLYLYLFTCPHAEQPRRAVRLRPQNGV